MIYLIDRLDFELFDNLSRYVSLDMWETTEDRVKKWIENERSRSLIDKFEIVNLFRIGHKVQMLRIKKIKLKKFDKIIVWTTNKRYFVMEVKGNHG